VSTWNASAERNHSRSRREGVTSEQARIAGRRQALEARARIRRAVRAWFDGQGFLEVETPARVRAPGQEVHLDAIPAFDRDERYLITSPEYHMKRLCGAGYQRVYQLGRSFRAGERGPHHQPEFTMLEWYRADPSLERVAQDCEEILTVAAQAAGVSPLPVPFERTTIRALVARHAGIDLLGDESPAELREKAARAGVATTAPAWDDIFFQLFLDRVEPHLGHAHPTFVFDWPAPLGALARRHPTDPRLVERFELYAGGLELVNAFGELIDPAEQRRRFEEETAYRRAHGKVVYPLDEQLLSALATMPPTCGAAMGFDRLVMLVLGAGDIRSVVAFADDEV
jgi:lysyl-tRNA synthetase class 2